MTVVDYGRTVSFGICRSEFDDYLLHRSGARLCLGEPVRAIERSGQDWVLNGQYQTPLLLAAGGNFCPVARLMGMAVAEKGPVVAAEEFEITLTPSQQAACAVDPQVPEIYFCRDLLGYGWCLRKGPLLNVGLGREDRRGLPAQVKNFCEFLERQGRIAEQSAGQVPRTCLSTIRSLDATSAGRRRAVDRRCGRPGLDAKRRRDWPGGRVGLTVGEGNSGGQRRLSSRKVGAVRAVDRGPIRPAAAPGGR